MNQYQQVIFAKRLTTFHYTLAPVGGTTGERPTISDIWHEGEAGTTAKELISMLYKMTVELPLKGKEHITIYCNNCSSRNKNYCICKLLWALVHANNDNIKIITLKFFEAGHTFMATDNVMLVWRGK